MTKTVWGLIALSFALALGGCATSPYNGYVSASRDDLAHVEKGEFSDAAMAQIALVQHPEINGGIIPVGALKRVQEDAISCQWQLDPQLAGAGRSTVTSGLSYGLAGAAGTGLGANAAFGSAVKAGEYATYGGVAMLFSGAVNGLVSGSYSASAAKGDCVKQLWSIDQKKNPKFEGTFVVIVYAGKSSNSRPPALDQSVTMP